MSFFSSSLKSLIVLGVQTRVETYLAYFFFLSCNNLIEVMHGKWSDNWLITILDENAVMGNGDLQYTWSIRLQLLFANLVGNVILG